MKQWTSANQTKECNTVSAHVHAVDGVNISDSSKMAAVSKRKATKDGEDFQY